MGSRVRVGVVLGTRPEVIKLAPVVAALKASPVYEPVVISTGQHRELLDQLLSLFGVQPDLDLDLMVPGQSLTDLAGRAVQQMGSAIERLRLGMLIVQGDTTTTMAGALAGFYARVPVAHVEAGLRTGDRFAPYPEEVNRRIVTQLADLHLAPTETARAALVAEGVDRSHGGGHRQHGGGCVVRHCAASPALRRAGRGAASRKWPRVRVGWCW